MVSSKSTLRPGDRVIVTWGLGTVEAEVEDVYESAGKVRAVLRVPVLGPAGEALDHMTVPMPVSEIQSVLA